MLSTPSLGITPDGVGHGERLARLSTPSLGITVILVKQPARRCYLTFNSLSRDHSGSPNPRSNYLAHNHLTFQLPLSGSQLYEGMLMISRNCTTFNSLSRDHLVVRMMDDRYIAIRCTFNSLSRDHRARFRDFSALRGFLPRHPFAQMIPKTTIWIYRFAPL